MRPRSRPTSRSSRRSAARASPLWNGCARLVPNDVPFIADAKRGDISTTAARQAAALYDALGADAVTANPYLGREAIAPLLERSDRFVYVLCRTSNPGAGEFQNLAVEGGDPLYLHVARSVAEWSETWRSGRARGRAPPRRPSWPRSERPRPVCRSSSPGSAHRAATSTRCGKAVRQAPHPPRRMRGGGLIVNVSRGIASAASGRHAIQGPRLRLPPRAGRASSSARMRPCRSYDIGPFELIIVLIIALMVLGPGKLPEVGSAHRTSIREFRKASTDLTSDATKPAATVDVTPAAPVETPEEQLARITRERISSPPSCVSTRRRQVAQDEGASAT